ncbi:M20 family metallopeptidase [Streptomyces cinnamoneus]|uniref:M20 family metallopeptidase n=1 Tax=Streptomyces cinnamoneus TaxID=53446 RepID=UPI0037AA1840
MKPSLREAATALGAGLSELRRELHRWPETGLELPRTQERILGELAGLPVEVTTGKRLSSVTAVLRGARPGPAVLLRADMDALPVTEGLDLPYASRAPGRTHACGHDLHVAALVGAARLLASRREELAGDVVMMFQPGEEGYGGARLMLEEGVLGAAGRRPVAAYAVHVVASGVPKGVFATRPGVVLAASATLRVVLRGAGGHGAQPHTTRDPVPGLCETVLALQSMVTRRFDVRDPVVLTVGALGAGEVGHVIPDSGRFEATVRTFSSGALERVREESARVVRGVADAHGLEAEFSFEELYPATVNDPAEAAFAGEVAREVLGPGRFSELPEPVCASEDFAYVAARVPSTFLLLGAGEPGATASNHSPLAAFDDAVLPTAAALLAGLALRRAGRKDASG